MSIRPTPRRVSTLVGIGIALLVAASLVASSSLAAGVSGRIAFVRTPDSSGLGDIWTMKRNGQDQRPLPLNDPAANDHSPAYSPNGKWIAFVSNRGDPDDVDLYIARANGTDVKPLRVDSGPEALNSSQPQWSPDSSRIVFVETNPMGVDSDVMIMNRNGGGVRRLAHTPAYEDAPSFAPNGTQITYTVEPSFGEADLRLIKPNGAGDRPLIATDEQEFGGRFMPDGRRIVFGIVAEPIELGDTQIWIARADGSGAHLIVNGPHGDRSQSPLKDGSDQILFETNRDDPGGLELYVADADGQNQQRLTFGGDSFRSSDPEPAPKASCGGRKATIIGTPRADRLIGGPLPDVIAGFGGRDKIKGLGRGDVLCGGAGRDRITGGAGRDQLIGGAGRDRLLGGPGNDRQRQ